MTTIKQIFWLAGLVAMFTISSCKKEEVASEEKIFLNKLSHTWHVTMVELDGQVVTGAFGGLAITFNKSGTITVANAVPPIWNADGVFELEKIGSVFILHRNDGVEITVVELEGGVLIMEFVFTASGGRLNSVSGQYRFRLATL
jgi:hypothetical protein